MDEILELGSLAKKNDEQAIKKLLEKYDSLIVSMSKKYLDMCYARVRDDDDFVQEAKVAFYTAIMTYSSEKKVTFGAYAKICIRNKLVSLLRVINSKKRQKRIEHEASYSNPTQDYLVKNELEKKLFFLAKNCLSLYEQEIFEHYLNGEKATEISKITGKGIKSINNAIYRIKAKLKKTLNQGT